MEEDESFIDALRDDFLTNNRVKNAPDPGFTINLMLFHCYLFDRKKLASLVDHFHEQYPDLETTKNGTTINGFTSKVRLATEAAEKKLRVREEMKEAQEAKRLMIEKKEKAAEAAEKLLEAEAHEMLEAKALEDLEQQQANERLPTPF